MTQPLPPRLPVRIRPAHHETLNSYVARLAAVHGLRYEDLWTNLSARRLSGTRRLIVLNRIAAATGHPRQALERALPELSDPPPDWQQLRHYPQHACPACTAGHPGGPVRSLHRHHQFLCTRHGYWIGPAYLFDNPPRRLATSIPELVDSQRRHDRLVRRHGWRTTYNAISRSFVFTIDLHFYGGAFTPGNPHDPRIYRLFPAGQPFITTHYIAAFYPEIVRLAELFCTTRWRTAAERALPWFRRPLDSPESTNATDRDAVIAAIAKAIRCSPDLISHPDHSLRMANWLENMIDRPRLVPDKTFPDTRIPTTLDGTPSTDNPDELKRVRQARRQFQTNGPIVSWLLPTNDRTEPDPTAARHSTTRGPHWIKLDEDDIAALGHPAQEGAN